MKEAANRDALRPQGVPEGEEIVADGGGEQDDGENAE